MVAINVDVPAGPNGYSADMRANWRIIEDRLVLLEDAAAPAGDFLPLTGGVLTGSLQLPAGTLQQPGLQFGAADSTGIWRSPGNILAVILAGSFSVAFTPTLAQFYTPVSLLNNRIQQLGDATGPGDAVNMRTGDARYAPVVLGDEVAALRNELTALRRLIDRHEISIPQGVAMQTKLVPQA